MRVLHKQNKLEGFMPDPAPDTLPAGAISFGQNVKATIRGWEKSDGYKETQYEPTNEKTHLMFWSPREGDDRWFVSGLTTIEYFQGRSRLDATREGSPYTAAGGYKWNSLDFNGVVIFNNGVDEPQFLGSKVKFENFPALDAKVRFKVVRSFKTYLIGLGVDLGTGFNDDNIYWSHPADPGTMPSSWDYANPAIDAAITSLPSEGKVLDSLEMGDVNIIYKSDSTWTMRFIGGQFIFKFDNKFPGQGILATGCVVSFESKHFVVTQTDIMLHDGIRTQSIADKTVKDFFFADISRTKYDRTFVCKRPEANEIWVCYPSRESVDGTCDKALVWNWRNNLWEPKTLPNLNYASYGYALPEQTQTWDTQISIWDQVGTWRLGEDAHVFAPAIHMAARDSSKLLVPYEAGLYIDQPIKSVWERKDILLGRTSRDGVVQQDYTSEKIISKIIFDVESKESFQVFLGTKDRLEDRVIWEDYGTFNPSEGKVMDVFITTSFLSIRIETEAIAFLVRNIGLGFELGGEMW